MNLFSAGRKVADYFVEESCPYTKKKTLNKKNVSYLALFGLGAFLIYVFVFVEDPKSQIPFFESKQVNQMPQNGQIQIGDSKKNDTDYFSGWFQSSAGSGGGASTTRNRNANQVVVRGTGNGDPAAKLPMGFGIPTRLVNNVDSTDLASPAIAEVAQDVFSVSGDTLVIPASTRIIGTATFNAQERKIQLHFNTFVFPDGEQASLQGLGMAANGSAGLVGDYHSEALKRRAGSFIGTFVGGLVEGMKERTAVGTSGTPFEVGSLRNGILNGTARTAEDQTRSLSEELSQTKPYMTLNSGAGFVVYLEREFAR